MKIKDAKPGCYLVITNDDKAIYAGQSKDVPKRLKQHSKRFNDIKHVIYFEENNELNRLTKEKFLQRYLDPHKNIYGTSRSRIRRGFRMMSANQETLFEL